MKFQNAPSVAGVWITLLGVFTLSARAMAQAPAFHHTPTPYVDVISPTAARMNGSGFILILNGTGFVSSSQVGFQVGNTTQHLPAFVVNATEVAAYVPASLLRKAATATVTVFNGQTPGLVGTSNPMLLPITVPTASVSFNQTNVTLGENPNAIVAADFNGDGKADLAVSEPCGNDPTCSNYNGSIAILLGNGDGTFTAAASPAVNQFPGALAVGDFNGDGKTDIAVLNFAGSSVTILLGNGHGGFTAAPSTVAVGGNPDSIAVGDLNGDGKLDLAVVNFEDSDVSILLGNGDGSFTAAASPTVGSQPGAVFLGDTNGDGKLDLVVNTDFSPFVNVLLGRGDGTFIAAPTPTAPTGPLALSDVNRDGTLDLVFAEGNAPGFAQTTISVALGDGNGTFRTGPTSPVVNAGLGGGLLADFNGDGKLDLAGQVDYPSNSYDFFLGDGHGTFNLTNSINVSNEFNGPAVVGTLMGMAG